MNRIQKKRERSLFRIFQTEKSIKAAVYNVSSQDEIEERNIEFPQSSLLTKIREGIKRNPGREIKGEQSDSVSRAAVIALLREETKRGQISLLFLKRKANPRDPWSGQISFPGGRSKPEDANMLDTARRELLEETSIDLKECYLFGQLDELTPISRRSIRITPFVALAKSQMKVRLDDKEEIEAHFWVPFSYFLKERSETLERVVVEGRELQVPAFRISREYVIWGLTFRIINNLLTKIRSL